MKPEAVLQRAIVQLLGLYAAKGLLAFAHVPNGGYRTPAEAGQFQTFGVKAGVPDLLIWLPEARSFGVELKATSRGLSPAQRNWHGVMLALGHRTYVVRSVDEMEAVLRREGVPAVG